MLTPVVRTCVRVRYYWSWTPRTRATHWIFTFTIIMRVSTTCVNRRMRIVSVVSCPVCTSDMYRTGLPALSKYYEHPNAACSDLTRKTWHFFRFALSPTNISRDNLQLCLDIYADDRHLTDTHLRCHRILAPISCSAVRNLYHLIILSILFTLYSIHISNA